MDCRPSAVARTRLISVMAEVASAAWRLQVRHFEAGEWIVEQNARARHAAECYLILSGEAGVLMHARASPLADAATGLLHLCTRRAGNFVGAVQLTADPADGGGGSPGGRWSGGGTPPAGGCGALAASFSSDSVTLASMAWREDSWPRCGGGRSTSQLSAPGGGGRSTSQLSAPDGGGSDGGGFDSRSHELACAAAAASLKLRVVFMVLRVAKRCGTPKPRRPLRSP